MKKLFITATLLLLLFLKPLFAGVDKGIDVTEVQRMLTELCFKPGPIDGVWGKKTEAAFKEFFRHFGNYDGNLDSREFRILSKNHKDISKNKDCSYQSSKVPNGYGNKTINLTDGKSFNFYKMGDDTPWIAPRAGVDLIDLSKIDCQWFKSRKKTKCHMSLSPIYNFPKDGVSIQKDFVRSGDFAWKFKNGQGDCGQHYDLNDCTTNRERSEITMLSWPTSKKWFKFSMFIPDESEFTFGISNGVWQIHSEGANVDFMVRVGLRGELVWVDWRNGDWGGMKHTTILEPNDTRGKWNDFVIMLDFKRYPAKDSDIKVWANNKLQVNYTGRTQSFSTNVQYMKFGIYKSNIDRYSGPKRADSVVYYDAIAIGDTCEELNLENEGNSCMALE